MKPSLQSLARPADGARHHPPPRRMPSWLIPAGIAVGFALLFLLLFRDRLLPAPNVEVATVLTTPTDQAGPAPSNKSIETEWSGCLLAAMNRRGRFQRPSRLKAALAIHGGFKPPLQPSIIHP